MRVQVSIHMPADQVWQAGSDLMICGPKTYRAILWETEGRKAWLGRDWRRLKRERRKFIAQNEVAEVAA